MAKLIDFNRVSEKSSDDGLQNGDLDIKTTRLSSQFVADDVKNAFICSHHQSLSFVDNNQKQDAKKIYLQDSLKKGNNFTLEWNEVDLIIRSSFLSFGKKSKQLLTNASGSFKSGELTAILGPSGAGKSKLVDCIIGKLRQSSCANLSGTTRLIFDDPSVEAQRRAGNELLRVAIIPQQDYLFDSLTVFETLMFASQLKNSHLSNFNHIENIARVMKQLGLIECTSLLCGKLSGGQYKRVSIAQELLSAPDVLLLDEPTSGLDSITCFQVISALKALIASARSPLAVVTIIHQADPEVLDLFNKIYVLAGGGRPIFEGYTADILPAIANALIQVRATRSETVDLSCLPISGDKQAHGKEKMQKFDSDFALERLESLLGDQRCNPARLIVEAASGDFGAELVEELASRLQTQAQTQTKNHQSPLRCSSADSSASTVATISLLSINDTPPQGLPSPRTSTTTPNLDQDKFKPRKRKKAHLEPLFRVAAANRHTATLFVFTNQLLRHTHRSWLCIVRDPILCSVQVLLHITVPLLIAYCFRLHDLDACPNVEPLDLIAEAYSNNTSLIDEVSDELRLAIEAQSFFFMQLYIIIFASICGHALTYPLAMRVLIKEFRNGWYTTGAYFVGRTLADIPILAFNSVLGIGISYYLTGQATSHFEWRFVCVATLTVLATLIAQTQGLMFGALLMESPQSTVFIAPGTTAPLIVVCGFLLRIQSLPTALQVASKLSYLTHLLRGVLISRYGFNRCSCEPEQFEMTTGHELPKQARAFIDLWVNSYQSEYEINATTSDNIISTPPIDVTEKLLAAIGKARTFGFDIKNCSQVKPFALLDNNLSDSDLASCFGILVAMLLGFRLVTYAALRWKLNRCL